MQQQLTDITVAPLAGAWIETVEARKASIEEAVAPLAGAWIETTSAAGCSYMYDVAPLAGAWIETQQEMIAPIRKGSHPSRVRGLKHTNRQGLKKPVRRTPRGCVD